MKKINKKVAAIYCRTATSGQSTTGSLNKQCRVCKKAAKRDGIKLFKVIKDVGESGTSLNRPGIKEVIKLVNNRKIDVVYTTDSDRISRNIADYVLIKKLFEGYEVKLKITTQPFLNDETPESKLMQQILLTFDKYHRQKLSERIKQGIARKKSKLQVDSNN